MDRLRIVSVIAALCCLAPMAGAQNSAPTTSAGEVPGTICVVGDVIRPNVYPLPAGSRVTLRDAMTSAGQAAETANVTVLRTAQGSHQWTQFVTRTSVDGGPPLVAGDVVVVVSMSQPDQMVPPNAAVIAPAHNLVIGLADGPVSAGDVLVRLGIPPELVSSAQVMSFEMNRPFRNDADLMTPVAHGSVLKLMNGAGPGMTTGAVRTASLPSWSEWKPGAEAASPTMGAGVSSGITGISVPAGEQVPAAAQYPSSPSAVGPPEAFGSSSGPVPGGSTGALTIPDTTFMNDNRGAIVAEESPFRVVSDSGTGDGSTGIPESPAADAFSRGGDPAETLSAGSQDESTEALLMDTQTASASGSGLSVWNLTVVCGLLVGGGLILSGWYRSQSAMASEEVRVGSAPSHSEHSRSGFSGSNQRMTSSHDSARDLPAAKGAANPISSGHSEKAAARGIPDEDARRDNLSGIAGAAAGAAAGGSQSVEPHRTIPEDTFPEVVTRKPQTLVAPGEWFGRDLWRKPLQTEDAGELTGATVAGESVTPVVHTTPMEVRPPAPVSESTNATAARVVQTTQTITGAEAVVGRQTAVTTAAGASDSEAERLLEQLVGDMPGVATPSDLFSDLEDLIQNRLPIDLCTARLPLRVALFGRAAGPRRLRIDAAHSPLQGPHSPMRSGRSERGTQESAAAESRGGAAGFDRALQSAHERNSP